MKQMHQVLMAACLVVPMVAAGFGLVRADAPGSRYSASGGVVTDNCTGLRWQQAQSIERTWAAAVTYCQTNPDLLPGNGWRLPTIKELQSIVDETAFSPAIDGVFSPTSTGACFWSSSPVVGDQNKAWFIFSDTGQAYNRYRVVNDSCRVRCVR